MPFQRKRVGAIVVMDTKTLEIEHIYVHMTMRSAMREFVGSLRANIDIAYDDMREELADALERYQFIEVSNVTIGRR